MIPFGVGDRVFVMPDPAPDLAWVGTVRAVSGDRARIELPPAPAGVAPLAPGGTVQLAIRQDGGIVLVAAEVVALGEREVELRAWTKEAPLGRSPRPVSRRHLRTELRSACEVAFDGRASATAWLADLGAGGAEIVLRGEVAVAPGARGVCTVALPGEAPWTIEVRVVRVAREPDETRAGVAFEGLAPDIESRIDAFVHFVRRTRLTRRPPREESMPVSHLDALVALARRVPSIDAGYPLRAPTFEPPATSDALEALEALVAIALPAAYRDFLLACSGFTAMDVHNGYELFTPAKIVAMAATAPHIGTEPGSRSLVIGGDGGGNLFALLLPRGDVWKWQHETGAVVPIARSFDDFLDRLVADWTHFVDADEPWDYLSG